MFSLSRSFGRYLYDQIKTTSAAPLLLVAHLEHVGFRGMVHICTVFSTRTRARAHATISSTFCSERVLILSILCLMKLQVDLIHALSLKLFGFRLFVLLLCWVERELSSYNECLDQKQRGTEQKNLIRLKHY